MASPEVIKKIVLEARQAGMRAKDIYNIPIVKANYRHIVEEMRTYYKEDAIMFPVVRKTKGRPSKTAEEKKKYKLTIYFNKQEYDDVFLQSQKLDSYKTISGFIRTAIQHYMQFCKQRELDISNKFYGGEKDGQ